MKKPTDAELQAHPEVRDMMDDLGKATAIEVTAKSEGGKILIEGLTSDIVSSIDTLSLKYSVLTLPQFISLCADMKSKIDLARVLTRAPKNKKALETLIKETLVS